VVTRLDKSVSYGVAGKWRNRMAKTASGSKASTKAASGSVSSINIKHVARAHARCVLCVVWRWYNRAPSLALKA